MKALAYETAHSLAAFALELTDVAEPRLRDTDLLIEIRAVAVNPGEAAIRGMPPSLNWSPCCWSRRIK